MDDKEIEIIRAKIEKRFNQMLPIGAKIEIGKLNDSNVIFRATVGIGYTASIDALIGGSADYAEYISHRMAESMKRLTQDAIDASGPMKVPPPRFLYRFS